MNERLSFHLRGANTSHLLVGVPSQHPHAEEGLQSAQLPTANKETGLACKELSVGHVVDLVVQQHGVCSGGCAGWDGSQGGRNAGASQPPTSPSSPRIQQGAGMPWMYLLTPCVSSASDLVVK